ncbi:hypothetical protein [Hyphomonas sp.]|uniref:hypothetical protein n=1 Tax=Hyphomonas sp. TaxID=87 RepID=UPI00391A80EB
MTAPADLIPARLSALKAGQSVISRELGPCLPDGAHTVCRAPDGLFLPCADGRHYLDGQTLEDGDTLAGLFLAPELETVAAEDELTRWLDASGDPGGAPAGTLDAAEAMLRERRRQIVAEGFDPQADDRYTDGQLARAAARYAVWNILPETGRAMIVWLWPFAAGWFKPRTHRENLVRAGALILAEIERLDRKAAREGV